MHHPTDLALTAGTVTNECRADQAKPLQCRQCMVEILRHHQRRHPQRLHIGPKLVELARGQAKIGNGRPWVGAPGHDDPVVDLL
jgi:hypothetical protein